MVLLIGCLLSIAERYIIGRDFSIHVSSLVILTALFVLAIKGDFECAPKWLLTLGRDDSLIVYIVHPAVYLTMDCVLAAFSDSQVYLWIRPIVTVFISIVLARLFLVLQKKRKTVRGA